ncbi:MAG: hypothetical protein CL573_06600 [Alphaproteobacteria bacterium]|nr:hypothetical protein [Alphaproteobacteria bacterium]
MIDYIENTDLSRLLDRVGRMSRGLQYSHGLNPAQWDCLRFLGKANRFSRTPGGLSAFLGTTKGTASQTLNALEKKGYLSRLRDPEDGRVRYIELTRRGTDLLADDPLNCLDKAISNLPPEILDSMTQGLNRIFIEMQARSGGQDLGFCKTCGHSEGETRAGNTICGFKQAELTYEDATKFCVNFSPET